MRARFRFLALSEWRDNNRQNIYLLHGIGLEEAIQLDGKEDIELQSEDAAELVKTSIYQRDRIQQEEIALQRAYAEEQQKRAEAETSRAQEAENAAETQRKSGVRFRRLAGSALSSGRCHCFDCSLACYPTEQNSYGARPDRRGPIADNRS